MEFQTGWIDFPERTNEQNDTHSLIVSRMPAFSLVGSKPEVGTKILLTDFWKHPEVVTALGYEYPGTHQITGSCVWAGGQNVGQTLNFIEVCKLNQAERLILMFCLYNYGRSRLAGGMRGKGEGSFGSTFAKSLAEDGVCDARIAALNLPQPNNADALVWGSAVERDWSDGTRAPQAVRDEAKPRKIISAPLSSGEQVRDSIMNGYGVTRAFGKFVNPGTASVKNGALIGHYNGRGGHQESWLGYWNHPQNGELIWEQNQWGRKVYGVDPGGGPEGGCWIPIDEVDRECKSQYAEIYAMSSYDGYPAQPEVYDWSKQSFLS